MKRERLILFHRTDNDASPIIGMVADSGLLTRVAVSASVDCLFVLSAGFYRNAGISALAASLPFVNSNAVTERLLHAEVLPHAVDTPVVVGMLAGDPTSPLSDHLDRLTAAGVAGVVNYPPVTFLDGSFRAIFEDQGCTLEAELDLLKQAQARGLATVGFIGPDPEAAARFAELRPAALILNVSLARDVDDIHERRDRLQHAIRQLSSLLDAARRVHSEQVCLILGGPIAAPEDLEQVLRQLPIDGFVGGSVFGRLPIESSVTAIIRRFKGVTTRRTDERQTGFGPLIGATAEMRRLFHLIERAAAFDLNVCIEGESGTGKELVATQVHRLSRRAAAPLVTLNCGAIPDTLLESEFFGHEKGAFTGADRRRLGKFELANQGTLFLDEIGDLTPRGQVALLRAIQQREIVRVGGDAPIAIDHRLVVALNQPLARLVEQGRFRADLYYRLNNLTLVVPPLRERLDDVPLLVQPILASLRVQMNRNLTDLSPRFHDKLRRHHWPGNVRELQHVIAQAALLEDGQVLEGRHFTPVTPGSLTDRIAADLDSSRRAKVEQALTAAHGNKSQAAALLGVTRKTLYAWLREMDEGRR
jgi:two-component system response regulator HydG